MIEDVAASCFFVDAAVLKEVKRMPMKNLLGKYNRSRQGRSMFAAVVKILRSIRSLPSLRLLSVDEQPAQHPRA